MNMKDRKKSWKKNRDKYKFVASKKFNKELQNLKIKKIFYKKKKFKKNKKDRLKLKSKTN